MKAMEIPINGNISQPGEQCSFRMHLASKDRRDDCGLTPQGKVSGPKHNVESQS